MKKDDDVYIGVHEEFFFKSNTAAADFNKRINRNGWLVQRVIRFSDAQIQEKIPSPFPVRGSIF